MLDSSKVTTNDNSILFFCRTNCAYFNESIGKRKFLNCLKLADFTPLFKKGAHTPKNNYRPVRILPVFSISEKLLQKQLLVFFDILSKFQSSFRKVYGTYSCLLVMLEFWKDAADKKKHLECCKQTCQNHSIVFDMTC